ncbi:uncharacterized protein C8Q71DRAFT_229093 [Rhodofomes roseus]|uniref:DUF6697 domain-containing protein n=1 Tax=Rhodofomes roseus TaxID=34475 RepID=A0ABQ8KVA8_9APHY|nr:uncharacterized protein C8Q71DRAFT_229093 [Rhodofomes roseus]KAH9842958.1 hypothetical protein C8Q71DRAFT_229093 [Rhodofomes roseus]
MRGFRPREAKHLHKANVVTLVSYAKSQGLDCKRGRHSRDIIRFVNGPSGTLPIVLLSEDNITGSSGLLPSMHAAVYTPSSQMSKILNMRSFHLVLRIGAGREAGFQGQVLYHGVYRASDAQLLLPPERLASLSAEDRRNMLDFFNNSRLKEMKSKAEGRGEPKQDVANIPDADLEKLFETGQQRLALMVLKCLSFDSTFYKELMHADAITLIPVKTVGRIYPNWAKCHAEEMATAAQGLDVGRR